MENLTKKCNACLEEKELYEFGKDKDRPYGVSDKCKKCQLLKRPAIKFKPQGELKICEVCLEEKDICYFYKRSARSYSHEPRCMKCTKEGKVIDKKIIIGDE